MGPRARALRRLAVAHHVKHAYLVQPLAEVSDREGPGILEEDLARRGGSAVRGFVGGGSHVLAL
eukprot:2144497-Alexandrium_andersonii.AAC.1